MSCSSSLSSILGRSLARRTPTPLAASSRFLRAFPPSASASSPSSLLRRSLSSTPRRWDSSAPGISAPKGSLASGSEGSSSGITATWHPAEGNESKAPLRIDHEPKLSLTFTCTATLDPATPPPSSPEAALPPSSSTPVEDVICNHRSTHTFSKQAYTKGIVLVQCPSCENRHLIADHIGWFPEVTEADGGKRVMRDIQDIMREKGEEVKRGSLTGGEGGTIEFYQ